MHFRITVLFSPLLCDFAFYYNLEKLLKVISHESEVYIFSDFNIDWSDESKRKKLDFSQTVKSATRITKSTRSQINKIFANREEWVTKSYNFVTGLCDHNGISTARKLTKKQLPTYNNFVSTAEELANNSKIPNVNIPNSKN